VGVALTDSEDHCTIPQRGRQFRMKIERLKKPSVVIVGAPVLAKPVRVELGVPLWYSGGMSLGAGLEKVDWLECEEVFARSVLEALEEWALRWGFGITHLGCLVVRRARYADGRVIQPIRWSNHAYGLAIDWSGIVDGKGRWYRVDKMKTACPAKLRDVLDMVRKAIAEKGRESEIVDEGGWYHLGIWRA
jgi:hypothetical protein